MPDLKPGTQLRTVKFATITVKEKLGEGGQGAVYKVDYEGKEKALKWYTQRFKDPKRFYDNLKSNIKKKNDGIVPDTFLWPLDLCEWSGSHKESFGYIMDLRPGEYRDFSRFLIAKEKFSGITAMANAALNITEGFLQLHRLGLSYQDLNDGNFFINPKNGDVLICDNDNVMPYGKSSGIAGKARYMAPEVVLGKKHPDIMTDRFSLSVILFLLWCGNHPLEGKATYTQPCMTPKLERKYYGENPVFLFDPKDTSNTPVPGLHRAAMVKWPFLPDYLQNAFIESFSKEAMCKDPGVRIIELNWLKLFIRLRGEIYKCPCGEVYFTNPKDPHPCPKCKNVAGLDMYIKTPHYNVPIHGLTRLYACHLEKDPEDFRTLVGKVSEIGSAFALGNCSKDKWLVTIDGKDSTVEPNKAIGLKKGMTINFGGGGSAEIV